MSTAADPVGSHRIIRVGSSVGNPSYTYRDFRIDNNVFNQCGASGGNTTGRDALSLMGFVYGVVAHKTFNDCNGECIDICADAIPGQARSKAFGQYSNRTIFIENNVFNANRSGLLYENVTDGIPPSGSLSVSTRSTSQTVHST